MKEHNMNIFVIPAPLESIYKILSNEGFIEHSEGTGRTGRTDRTEGYEDTKEFSFIKPICNLNWCYVKKIV